METTTVLVADLVGSTKAIAAVPQVRMGEMMTEAVVPIRRVVERLGGEVIKFTGDGYLTAFRSATDALHAAAQIVNLFISGPRLPIGEWVDGCRVAVHTCDTIRFENDLLGEGVVVPARMEKHVPTNAVYVTSTTVDASKSAEFNFDLVGDLEFAGIPRPVRVYRLLAERYRGIERGVFLTVTDLVGLNALAEQLPLTALNERLHRWVAMHHEALDATGGRLRSVAGDNVLATHETGDDAVRFLSALEYLARGAVDTTLPSQAPAGRAESGRAASGSGLLAVPAAEGAMPTESESNGQQPQLAANASSLPQRAPFLFSAVTAYGDLFVPDFGLAGPLVTNTCRTLQALPPGEKIVASAVLARLTSGRAAFDGGLPSPPPAIPDGFHLFRPCPGADNPERDDAPRVRSASAPEGV